MTIRNDVSDPSYESGYLKRNPRHSDLVAIANSLVAKVGSYRDFEARMGGMVRKALDEVIDTPRTGRWKMTQLEKTEKTYLGTKVEILLRHELGLRRGKKLDLEVDGHEVDVKNTVGSKKAKGHILQFEKVYSGLFRCKFQPPSHQSAPLNRDRLGA